MKPLPSLERLRTALSPETQNRRLRRKEPAMFLMVLIFLLLLVLTFWRHPG